MNEQERKKARALIGHFLSGKLPADLDRRVGEWLARLGEQDEGYSLMQHVYERFAERFPGRSMRTARAWRKRCSELGYTDRGAARRVSLLLARRVAAVLLPFLLLLGGGVLWLKSGAGVGGSADGVYATVEAPALTRHVVTLPCGTEVILAAGSRLLYDEAGYGSDRTVRLEGEAYFSVTRRDGASFTVEAGEVSVQVTGTEFNVKTGGEGTAEVSLFRGSVEVTARGRKFLLAPSDQLVLDGPGREPVVRSFDEEAVGGWRTSLALDNVPLEEAFAMIGSHFGVGIELDGGFGAGGKIVRARYRDGDLEQVLELLRHADEDFDYEIKGDTVYITSHSGDK